jgi:hypothetical protein
VTYGYISDIHERKDGQTGCTTAGATSAGSALGPGDPCYLATAAAYDQAFATFFQRMAADGMTTKNTLFLMTAEENDHFVGANTLRASQPSPANCDGVNVACNYAANQVGEVQANLPQLLAKERGNTTPFAVEPQGAAMYVIGNPAQNDPSLRQLERDTAALTTNNPYTGKADQQVVNYQTGRVGQRILHMQTADPGRTPSYTIFPEPDYFFDMTFPKCGASTNPAADCAAVNSRFAWDHGYYAPDIDITWAGFAGPGVAHRGLLGPDPQHGATATAAGQNGSPDLTVPEASKGPWVEETDLRPTLLALSDLRDDYLSDGTVLSVVTSHRGEDGDDNGQGDEDGHSRLDVLADVYKQLNSSVGAFGTFALIADSKALASSSTNDATFTKVQDRLTTLADKRDALAQQIKVTLDDAQHGHHHVNPHVVGDETARAIVLITEMQALAASVS